MKTWKILAISLVIGTGAMAQESEGVTGEGKTKDGVKVGKWTYTCNETGKVSAEENYDGKGLKHGYQTMYNCDGVILAEYEYDHGKKMGLQREYYDFGKQLKREWYMVETPKSCRETSDQTDPEWYKEWYGNGRLKIEMKGDICGERTVTKFRESNGTEWIVKYDDRGQWVSGPRDEVRKLDTPDLR